MPYYQSNTVKYTLCSSSSPLGKGGGEVLERICSKLGGGLERAIVPVDSSVAPIEGPYATRAGELQDMVLRNVDCANLSAEYSLIDSHFSIIEALKAANNKEPDLYFYHSDHLGSSSFITDADGIVSQHLQYLPYGELFVEQRDNTARYYTPYKFSGKEKDEETGYSYFGARYYMPELSIWSAVDVMADERSWLSPYNYCQNNPVINIDPDGMLDGDIYNLNGEHIGNDGKDDNKVYIKQTNSSAQLSTQEALEHTTLAQNAPSISNTIDVTATTGLTNNELNLRSTLSTLRKAEAGRSNPPLEYNSWNHGYMFTNDSYESNPSAYAKHPGINPKSESSAAGAYQAMIYSYTGTDFSPESQDKFAVNLMGTKSYKAALAGDMSKFKSSTSGRWTSLKSWKVNNLEKIFNSYRAKELFGITNIATPIGSATKLRIR